MPCKFILAPRRVDFGLDRAAFRFALQIECPLNSTRHEFCLLEKASVKRLPRRVCALAPPFNAPTIMLSIFFMVIDLTESQLSQRPCPIRVHTERPDRQARYERPP